MKNLKISVKMIICFGLAILMMLIMSISSIAGFKIVSNELDKFYKVPFKNVQLADSINTNLQMAARNMLEAILESKNDDIEMRLTLASEELGTIKDSIETLKQSYTGDPAILDEIRSCCDDVTAAYNDFAERCRANFNDLSLNVYKSKISGRLSEADEKILIVTEEVERYAQSIYNEGELTGTIAMILAGIVSTVGIALAAASAIYLTKYITHAVIEINNAAGKMAQGNFDVEIKYTSNDELGQLSESMRTLCSSTNKVISDLDYVLKNASEGDLTVDSREESAYVGSYIELLNSMRSFLEKLQNMLSKINDAAEQVSSGSDQVSAGAQALAQGATEQASSVEELAATIQNIHAQINTNASHSKEANEKTNAAGTEMGVANDKMNALVKAMEEIKQCSTKISEIIKTIEDIAFQTNILSLNAAIEAARAGAAGKGFAVVADEVRNLASKSAEAANNTNDLIENTVRAIEYGNNLVDEVADMMKVVSEASQVVAKLNSEIAVGSSDAAQSINQINIGVDQISNVVQTNSATAQESAAASEELSGQAAMLKDLISQFKFNIRN